MRQLRKNVTRPVRDGMTFAITLSAVSVFLSAAAIVILAILVAAIRSDDRAKNLTCAPRTRTEQVTRRLLGVGVGVRTDDAGTPSCPAFPESDLPSPSQFPSPSPTPEPARTSPAAAGHRASN
jgi:hypothetical protein